LRKFEKIMKKPSGDIKVLVSALALFSSPMRSAVAAATIACTRGIDFGRIVPSCAGSITVRATSASNTINNGCHSLVGGAIQPGICSIQTTVGPTATMDALVNFSVGSVTFNNGFSGTVTLDNFRIQTAGGDVLNSFTFPSALLNPTHIFKVGGRLRFGAAEPVGSYNSNFNIVVTSIP
jgi:hypothetical protein